MRPLPFVQVSPAASAAATPAADGDDNDDDGDAFRIAAVLDLLILMV